MKQVWDPLPRITWLVRGHDLSDLYCPDLCLPQVRPIDNQGAQAVSWASGSGIWRWVGGPAEGNFYLPTLIASPEREAEKGCCGLPILSFGQTTSSESRETVCGGGWGGVLEGWQGWVEVHSLLRNPSSGRMT